MNSEVGTIIARNGCHGAIMSQSRKLSFPVDYYCEMPIGRLSAGARAAYLLDAEDPESVRCLGHGRHHVRGGRHLVAIESTDRLFLAPDCDCVLDYSARAVDLVDAVPGADTMAVGVMKMSRPAIVTGPETEALFHAVSAICAQPGETSPYRSHPIFRCHPQDIRLSQESTGLPSLSQSNPINMRLPPDLRYLYAAAPLAYYLGASIETAAEPTLEITGRSLICHRTTGISSAGRERC